MFLSREETSLPCKKCAVDSHGTFTSFHITNWRQLGQNPHKIPWRFHVFNPDIINIFHGKTWHGFWSSSSHGISMTFTKKMMGFPADLISFSNQTKLPSKRHEKIHVTFWTGISWIIKDFFWEKERFFKLLSAFSKGAYLLIASKKP